MRGLEIDGQRVFYRSPEEHSAHEEEDHKLAKARKLEDFEKARASLDDQFETLPEPFKERLRWFRKKDGWRAEFEAYEMSVCLDAVRIASALKTEDAIRAFWDLPWDEKRAAVAGLFDGHSGNSFGAACKLAMLYVKDQMLVTIQHGALCPLVGCTEYGCWAGSNPTTSP